MHSELDNYYGLEVCCMESRTQGPLVQSKATKLLTAGISGVVLCIVGVAMMWSSIETSTWEQWQATVTGISWVERRGKQSTSYIPYVAYQYENSSHQYRGHGINHGAKTRFKVGAPLTIYVNPADPSQSSLAKGLQLVDFTVPTAIPLLMGLVLIAASIISCLAARCKRA